MIGSSARTKHEAGDIDMEKAKKRGRPFGKTGKRTLPNKGSINSKLCLLGVGERLYIETTVDDYENKAKNLLKGEKYLPVMIQQWKFIRNVLVCVSASNIKDIRYLICIERVE
jgi:hypothetical protein